MVRHFDPPKTRTCKWCKRLRRMADQRARICVECEPAWRERNKKKRETKARLTEAYMGLAEEHGPCCMICGMEQRKRRANVDHCHRTGKIRGLLCYRCNYGLRWFRDNPEFLKSAAHYLEQFGADAPVKELAETVLK